MCCGGSFGIALPRGPQGAGDGHVGRQNRMGYCSPQNPAKFLRLHTKKMEDKISGNIPRRAPKSSGGAPCIHHPPPWDRTTVQNCEAVPRRARIQGAQTSVSLDSRLESNKERERKKLAEAIWAGEHAGNDHTGRQDLPHGLLFLAQSQNPAQNS